MAAIHVHDDGEVGFEEGMLWLPSHVLNEACGTKVCLRNRHQKFQNHQQMHQQRHHKSPGEPKSQYSKSGSRSSYQRPKLANGGPGMRAIFLGSTHRSCGTGVFLPQRAGTNFQPSKRPACAPILVPAGVIQALNLNFRVMTQDAGKYTIIIQKKRKVIRKIRPSNVVLYLRINVLLQRYFSQRNGLTS
ncbi:hypothetical protein AAZX31_10G025600 [Glycine max]